MRWLTRYAKWLLVVYSVALAVALFSPSSSDQSGMVYWLTQRLWGLGFSHQFVSYPRLEVVMNAIIVAPVTLLTTFIWRQFSWRDWTAFGFVASSLVEMTQLVFLPGRQASFSDVVANTGGALLGAVVFLVLRRALLARRARAVAVSAAEQPSSGR
jgi:glycopeptide antibiotics resistance protein